MRNLKIDEINNLAYFNITQEEFFNLLKELTRGQVIQYKVSQVQLPFTLENTYRLEIYKNTPSHKFIVESIGVNLMELGYTC